ncbi:MAG: PAS domain-containing protein, partial [Firmicutes bacterium]|nr:PAS domain-containing protein [Bacillota bacterium]
MKDTSIQKERRTGVDRRKEVNERARLLLDATPFGTLFWNKNHKMVDCNKTALNLFELTEKRELLDNFQAISPKIQPDGRLSQKAARELLQHAFSEGYAKAEWMLQTIDGKPIPCEIIVVRIDYPGESVAVSYIVDLSERKRMLKDIERRDNVLDVINRVASVLLAESKEDSFEKTLLDGMEIIGKSLNADCVQIWPNEMHNGALCFTLRYNWLSEAGKKVPDVPLGTPVPYSKRWMELFLRGENVNGPVKSLPQEDQDLLRPLGLLSTITIPLFYQEKFWGVFCVDDVVVERFFSQDEIDMLRSTSLMLVNAINRNDQETQIRNTAAKLNLAIQVSKIGPWEMEIVGGNPENPNNAFIWSNELRHLLGFRDETDFPNVLESLSDRLHPDEWKRVNDAFLAHLLDTTGKATYDIEFRILKKNGEYSYFHDTGVSVRDKNGRLIRVVGTMVDITETKNIILDSERQRIQAEAANKAKSAFLSTMSHEIRTPMNAIIGMTAIGKLSNDLHKKDDALQKIDVASKHLLGIINDILDMSKIEAEKFELSVASFNFEKMLQKVADVINLRVDGRRQRFYIHIDQNMPQMLVGDDQRLAQVVTNLLSNAVKFTPEEGSIRLDCRLLSEENCMCLLQISVEDTGIGISAEQKARLFTSFEQAE